MSTEDDADELKRRLLADETGVPTSVLSRMGRTGLAAWRARRLVKDRGDLDLDDLAGFVASVGRLKGVAMKMGQIMSYIDVALPQELRSALAVLQTHSQPMPVEEVRGIVRDELGAAADHLVGTMEPRPIAAASIGQVHRAVLPDGTRVAVKVQYPKVRSAIEHDFDVARIGPRVAALVYPGANVGPLIREARARLLEECDYEHEARMQRRFRDLFRDHGTITVPEVHDAWCSAHVLTTTFVDGLDLDGWLATGPSQAERDRIGEALFEFYVGSLFRHGVYNCDPHPGNYVFPGDGRIAILDHGCAREFEPGFVAKLAALTRAVHADDEDRLAEALWALGVLPRDEREHLGTARDLLRAFYGPMATDERRPIRLDEVIELRSIVATKRELMRLNLPGEFLFLFRIRFGLMSVLARLGAEANWFRLEGSYATAALDTARRRR